MEPWFQRINRFKTPYTYVEYILPPVQTQLTHQHERIFCYAMQKKATVTFSIPGVRIQIHCRSIMICASLKNRNPLPNDWYFTDSISSVLLFRKVKVVYSNINELCFHGPSWQIAISKWRQVSYKPLSKQMMIWPTDAFVRHQAPMRPNMYIWKYHMYPQRSC